MLDISSLREQFAEQVFQRMQQQSCLIHEGLYSDTTIDRLRLYIDLSKNNIPIDEAIQH